MIAYKVLSPCAERLGDKIKKRYKAGDEATLSKKEADRLLAAGCIEEIETATQTAPERRGRKKRNV